MEPSAAIRPPRRVPELVAPAGSVTTFLAGLRSGADAFYLGVGAFNARVRAQNFALEDLEGIVRTARERGKKIYLALNVLVSDREIPACTRLLEQAEACAVDAVIIQDLGVLHLLRRHFPGLAVHASTQMFLHNSLHIQALARRGVSRVILPRELRLEEIRGIRSRVPVELEVFIQGALCFSFSGLCLASSFLFGESGNRGVCKQICRFAFATEAGPAGGRPRHPFAMKDLEGRTCFEELLGVGIDSLKIEGRLRNTDYVEETVSYYRRCLDAYGARQPLPEPPRWRFSRTTTPGYFKPQPYERMICGESEPWIGEPVGRVTRLAGRKASLSLDKPVFRGERLRILRQDGVKVHEFTLLDHRGARCEVDLGAHVEAPAVGKRSTATVKRPSGADQQSRALYRGLTVSPPGRRAGRERHQDEPSDWQVYRVGTSQAPSLRSLKRKSGRLQTCNVDLALRHSPEGLRLQALLSGGLRFEAVFPVDSSDREAAHRDGLLPVCQPTTGPQPAAGTQPGGAPPQAGGSQRAHESQRASRARYRGVPTAGPTGGLSPERVRDCFTKVDQAPFKVGVIQVDLAAPLVIPIRSLNAVRREFYARLEALYDATTAKRNQARQQAIEAEFEDIGRKMIRQGHTAGELRDGRRGGIAGEGAGQVGVSGKGGLQAEGHRAKVPGGESALGPAAIDVVSWEEGFGEGSSAPSRTEGTLWVELPLFVSEGAVEDLRKTIERLLYDPGGLQERDDASLGFVCHSLGWVDYLRERVPAGRLAAGGFLYCYNRFAWQFLRDAGAGTILLSDDFPEEDVQDLLAMEGTARVREPALRFFITRQPVPAGTYRFGRHTLRAVRRGEYVEMTLFAGKKRAGQRGLRFPLRGPG